MLVHPEVEKALKRVHPDLVVRYNPKWNRDTNRFYVCQSIRFMRPIDERIGLFEETVWEYPVLGVDQASEIDQRWFQALAENRWDHQRKDPMDMVREESDRKRKLIHDRVHEWARDEGWYYAKKYGEQFSLAGMTRKDPTRETKERQDRNGRENLI